MKTRIFGVQRTSAMIVALILGWVAVVPVVGDVHAISGGACRGVTDCKSQKQGNCPAGCTAGTFNTCTTGSSNPGSCNPDGGDCGSNYGCPISCSCAGGIP
jgi:hypothetical protein